jgi:hypothetical protein
MGTGQKPPDKKLPILKYFTISVNLKSCLIRQVSYFKGIHVPKVCVLSKYLGSDVIMSFDWGEAIISIQ